MNAEQEQRLLCCLCTEPFDGPMLMFGSFVGVHARCAVRALALLLDPDADSEHEPQPLWRTLCPKVLAEGWVTWYKEKLWLLGEQTNALYKVYDKPRDDAKRPVLIVEADPEVSNERG